MRMKHDEHATQAPPRVTKPTISIFRSSTKTQAIVLNQQNLFKIQGPK